MPRPRWARPFLPVSWVILILGLLISNRGASGPAETLSLAGIGTLEALLLFAILRPMSYRYHSGRALAAVVFVLFASTFWAGRADPLPDSGYIVHLLWLLGLTVACCALLGFSLWQRLMARHRNRA